MLQSNCFPWILRAVANWQIKIDNINQFSHIKRQQQRQQHQRARDVCRGVCNSFSSFQLNDCNINTASPMCNVNTVNTIYGERIHTTGSASASKDCIRRREQVTGTICYHRRALYHIVPTYDCNWIRCLHFDVQTDKQKFQLFYYIDRISVFHARATLLHGGVDGDDDDGVSQVDRDEDKYTYLCVACVHMPTLE